MIYLLVLLPATALTVAGYVALFLSARSEGTMRSFGKYLGFWAFALAALLILGAIFAAAHGGHRCPMWMHGMHEGMHGAPPDGGPPTGTPPTSEAPSKAPNPKEAPTTPPANPYG
jgi:heme A synthase